MPALHKFMLKVDNAEPVEFASRHSEYAVAVLDAFGKLDLDYHCTVEIWMPHLVERGYGPYRFKITGFVDWHGNRYGSPSVLNLRVLENDDTN